MLLVPLHFPCFLTMSNADLFFVPAHSISLFLVVCLLVLPLFTYLLFFFHVPLHLFRVAMSVLLQLICTLDSSELINGQLDNIKITVITISPEFLNQRLKE